MESFGCGKSCFFRQLYEKNEYFRIKIWNDFIIWNFLFEWIQYFTRELERDAEWIPWT